MAVEMDKRNKTVVLSLGGNIGDVNQAFKDTIKLLKQELGLLELSSSIYRTKAWGVENQPDFLNQVILMQTSFSPMEVLNSCLAIEKQLGRMRVVGEKWQERVVDIDVLFYEDITIDSAKLKIPHPYLHERNFVLFPLVEIIPEYTHPLLNKTMVELKNNCKDKLRVIKFLI